MRQGTAKRAEGPGVDSKNPGFNSKDPLLSQRLDRGVGLLGWRASVRPTIGQGIKGQEKRNVYTERRG